MRNVAALTCCLALIGGTAQAVAAACPGNPRALGTSRVMTLSPGELSRVGNMQYSRTLPLADREVVLTFDDGPLPPYSTQVLEALAAECVKAVYFLVGRQANAFPDMVRQIYNAGHTIGTHSQNHPLTFDRMSPERAEREITDGIASVTAALGDPTAVAPYFRIPGLLRVKPVEDYLASRSIITWSTDFVADDWYKNITAKESMRRALARLDSKGRGILLLHDVQPATALMLPALLKELKQRGYRIVQVVPGNSGARNLPVSSGPAKQGWPRIANTNNDSPPPIMMDNNNPPPASISAINTGRLGDKHSRKKSGKHEPAATAGTRKHSRRTDFRLGFFPR